MGSNFKNYMTEQTRERNETALESALSRGHRREPKEINDKIDSYVVEELLKISVLQEDEDKLSEIGLFFGKNNVTIDNPLPLYEEGILSESLIKTYSIESAKKHICKYFNLPENYFLIKRSKFNTYCFITFPNKGNSLDDIIKTMEWYGYFPSTKNIKPLENGWYVVKFESRFEENANSLLTNETHLIHITKTKFKDKILKYGFIPKSKNKKFNYPDRTYFMLGSNNPVETLKLAKNLSSVENGKEDLNGYMAFRIDVSKIPENVVFHLDPNMEGGIWTSDNIPPSAIMDRISLHN